MITFRTALPSDAFSITVLVNSAYRGDYAKKGWTTEAYLLEGQRTDDENILEMLNDPQAQIELVYDSKNPAIILGCVYLNFETKGSLYFGMLTVNPELQAQGLGKQLMSHLELKAKEKNCQRIRMTVISVRKELIAFYERRGYESTGKTEPFPMNEPRYGVPKTNLEFLEFIKTLT